ncbi:MAG: helix-turn-helix transcriptional regulator [Halanaerobiales bacterium]|nr:helix-turn-helix transcriptional regulator [Halanaerobiales bacterium]
MLNVEKLKELIVQRGWSEIQLAQKLNLDYSYIYRILRKQRDPGKKFYENLFRFCMQEKLNIYDYLLLK